VLAHNVRSTVEVDDVLAAAERAGARRGPTGRETFYGGYAGFFDDPDGHVWEVAHNPVSPSKPTAASTLPDFTQR
jgi:predicted lactoylglutathione lyase